MAGKVIVNAKNGTNKTIMLIYMHILMMHSFFTTNSTAEILN